ncbi:hypothetical protein [Anaerobacillus alkaliphilus]|uniref:hypothetical protein n=1 Tax=Anaerobacillus alkaliphilus TaxID=1548597 RepID=UPI0013758670|nr:hypothetical protein [Anaerobacillus alkaliphilus]
MFTNQYFLQAEAKYRYENLKQSVRQVKKEEEEITLPNLLNGMAQQKPCCNTICCAQ